MKPYTSTLPNPTSEELQAVISSAIRRTNKAIARRDWQTATNLNTFAFAMIKYREELYG